MPSAPLQMCERKDTLNFRIRRTATRLRPRRGGGCRDGGLSEAAGSPVDSGRLVDNRAWRLRVWRTPRFPSLLIRCHSVEGLPGVLES